MAWCLCSMVPKNTIHFWVITAYQDDSNIQQGLVTKVVKTGYVSCTIVFILRIVSGWRPLRYVNQCEYLSNIVLHMNICLYILCLWRSCRFYLQTYCRIRYFDDIAGDWCLGRFDESDAQTYDIVILVLQILHLELDEILEDCKHFNFFSEIFCL